MLAEQLWDWLCDNPLCNKKDFPNYKKIKNTTGSDCPLCTYHLYYRKNLDGDYCLKCILKTVCGGYTSGSKPYGQWNTNIYKCTPNEDISFNNACKIWKIIFDEKLRIM